MSYNLFGCNFMNAGGFDPYGVSMTNSLYMMNFYEQLKNYYAGSAGKATGGEAAGSGTGNRTSADFQAAFQDAFRKALQESMGIKDSTVSPSQTASDRGNAVAGNVTDRGTSASSAYQAMSSYGCHPSHIWTSRFARG